ncbi:MAG: IscA/HesB family protein [Pseudomonadota bacterium]
MFEITESAMKELAAYFADKEKTPIRIYLAPGGCSGPRLALALDNPSDDDTSFTEGDFTFCINTALLGEIESVRIDMTYMGFQIEPGKALAGSGGGCSGCGSSSSCCTH